MRLFTYIGSLVGGGAERVTVNLSNTLVQKGHDVTVATMADATRDAYRLSPQVSRLALGLAGRNRGVGKFFALVARIRALRSAIRRDRPDTVLAMMTQESLVAILACAGLPVRLVVSERSAFWMRRQPWFWARLFRWVYRYSDAQVVQTQEIARRVRLETGARSVVVIPNAVQLPVVGLGDVTDPDAVVPPRDKFVLVIGSKPHTKGFDDALAAFRKVAGRMPGWHLVFLGLSHGSEWARRLISETTEQRIHVVEPVANMQDWYDRAAIFVLSSRTEGMPNALMEAMASGCACVAYDCQTGPGDLIQDGMNGCLVPPGDQEKLADALVSVAQDEKLRTRLGDNARSIAHSHALAVITSTWEDVLFRGSGLASDLSSGSAVIGTAGDCDRDRQRGYDAWN